MNHSGSVDSVGVVVIDLGVLGYHRDLIVISLHLKITNVTIIMCCTLYLCECINNVHKSKEKVLWYLTCGPL